MPGLLGFSRIGASRSAILASIALRSRSNPDQGPRNENPQRQTALGVVDRERSQGEPDMAYASSRARSHTRAASVRPGRQMALIFGCERAFPRKFRNLTSRSFL
jgi:hypothetical protein